MLFHWIAIYKNYAVAWLYKIHASDKTIKIRLKQKGKPYNCWEDLLRMQLLFNYIANLLCIFKHPSFVAHSLRCQLSVAFVPSQRNKMNVLSPVVDRIWSSWHSSFAWLIWIKLIVDICWILLCAIKPIVGTCRILLCVQYFLLCSFQSMLILQQHSSVFLALS